MRKTPPCRTLSVNALKQVIKRSFHALGLDIARARAPLPSPMQQHRIDLVLDVGANIGQFASLTRQVGYRGRIVSFEPLPDAYARLCETAGKDALWTVHPRCAVGAAPGSTTINIAKNSYSSSILPMLAAHSDAAPDSVYVGQVATAVVTIDSVFDLYGQDGNRVYLKIDTQGFEAEVLKGAIDTLPLITAVQLELSIVPLYAGQELYRYFFDFFASHGFTLWSIIPGFTNPETGQHLQFDAVFVNSRQLEAQPPGKG